MGKLHQFKKHAKTPYLDAFNLLLRTLGLRKKSVSYAHLEVNVWKNCYWSVKIRLININY